MNFRNNKKIYLQNECRPPENSSIQPRTHGEGKTGMSGPLQGPDPPTNFPGLPRAWRAAASWPGEAALARGIAPRKALRQNAYSGVLEEGSHIQEEYRRETWHPVQVAPPPVITGSHNGLGDVMTEVKIEYR